MKKKRPIKTKEQLLAQLASKTRKRLKLSACWIVRNEGLKLRHSISSVKEQVDELIVVDTGSTDDTVEAAKELGAIVFEQPWHDNFSDPRNLALEHAGGDWIVFLDADEYFANETAVNIRPSIEIAVGQKKNLLLINLVNIDEDNHNAVIDSTFLCRIYKKLDGIRYVGRIHEELAASDPRALEKTLIVPPNVLTINHTGYSRTVNRDKAQRNLKMLLAELDETDRPERIYGYLAQCYNGLDDFDNAEKYARLAIERSPRDSTFASSPHRILLNILGKADTSRFDERVLAARRAVEDFPMMPEFRAELAECLAADGRYEDAIREMKSALRNFASYRGLEPTQFDRSMVNLAEARIRKWSNIIGGQNL